jgi:hypothetical protein
VIDFLQSKIGATHVAYHFESTIPHYKADAFEDRKVWWRGRSRAPLDEENKDRQDEG